MPIKRRLSMQVIIKEEKKGSLLNSKPSNLKGEVLVNIIINYKLGLRLKLGRLAERVSPEPDNAVIIDIIQEDLTIANNTDNYLADRSSEDSINKEEEVKEEGPAIKKRKRASAGPQVYKYVCNSAVSEAFIMRYLIRKVMLPIN